MRKKSLLEQRTRPDPTRKIFNFRRPDPRVDLTRGQL